MARERGPAYDVRRSDRDRPAPSRARVANLLFVTVQDMQQRHPCPPSARASHGCRFLSRRHAIRIGRWLTLFAGLCVLTGCFPYREQIVPRIEGRLVRGAMPVAGVRIHVLPETFRAGCQPSRYTAVTDDAGAFTLVGKSRIGMIVPMGDRINTWGVCIEENGRLIEGFRDGSIGWPPRHIDMQCDLERTVRICEWSERNQR